LLLQRQELNLTIMKPIIKFAISILLTAALFHIACKKETSCEGCAEKNKPPIANVGPDQIITLSADSIECTAFNDPDGIIS
jgi:hypothetical protein